MKTFEELKTDIEALPPREYKRLFHWLSERDWQAWDMEIERDSAEGKLDFLIKEAREEKIKNLAFAHAEGVGHLGRRFEI